MPGIGAMKTGVALGGGVGLGGLLGWRAAQRDESMDTTDRFGYTASAAVAGGTGALALKTLGLGRLGKYGTSAMKGANYASKTLMWNPLKGAVGKPGTMGFGKGIPKGVGGPMAALAMFAVGVGAVAFGARSRPQTTAYGSNEYGETQYNRQSVKERMGMMGAVGDMVFGLNNARHG